MDLPRLFYNKPTRKLPAYKINEFLMLSTFPGGSTTTQVTQHNVFLIADFSAGKMKPYCKLKFYCTSLKKSHPVESTNSCIHVHCEEVRNRKITICNMAFWKSF